MYRVKVVRKSQIFEIARANDRDRLNLAKVSRKMKRQRELSPWIARSVDEKLVVSADKER